jgi:hypothetical protein
MNCIHGTDCPLCKAQAAKARKTKPGFDKAHRRRQLTAAKHWLTVCDEPFERVVYSHTDSYCDRFYYYAGGELIDEVGVPLEYYDLDDAGKLALIARVEAEEGHPLPA